MFLNPFGGKKSATKIYMEQVKPIFEDAGIQIQLEGPSAFPFCSFIHVI